MANSAASQALAEVTGGSAYKYKPGKWFGDYAAEQIAEQVQDGVSEIVNVVRNTPPAFPLWDNIVSLAVPRYEV
jgi:hypothetical protein